MAKTSKIIKNEKRKKLVAKYAARRAELIKVMKDANASMDDKIEAQKALAKMPRDASATRIRNRCALTGRPRAYLRRFGLSRIAFRELALQGQIPGVTKSSW